jgi:SAM-dependent methyltransferase
MPTRNRPFGLLARYYDDLLAGAGDRLNRGARGKILARHWPRIRRVLELACGSGATAVDLARKGLEVEALDNSAWFVRRTREHAAKAGVKVRVRRGDMRRFAVARPVDLVLCEFASLNHVDHRRELARVLRCAARALAPGGLLLFDVNTPLATKLQVAPVQFFEHENFLLVMRGEPSDRDRRVEVRLDWLLPAGRGLFRRARETISACCWSEAEIRRELRRAGFDSIRTFDGMDVRPPMKGAVRGTDLYVLARRRPSQRADRSRPRRGRP